MTATAAAPPPDLQSRCDLGQQQLMRMEYLEAEATLAAVEREAWAARDFDTLSRLYMPLQEARRQRRQRCGEGTVSLDLIAEGPGDQIEARHVIENYPHGQLLVAGWGSIAPALEVRRLQRQHALYVETFLAAVYRLADGGKIVAIIPSEDQPLPPAGVPVRDAEELLPQLPPHSIVLPEAQLPQGPQKGTWETYAHVMAMWERLHSPFLIAADAEQDPVARIEGYRRAIRVDYACELAHQKLSDTARWLVRENKHAVAGA